MTLASARASASALTALAVARATRSTLRGGGPVPDLPHHRQHVDAGRDHQPAGSPREILRCQQRGMTVVAAELP